MGKVQQTHTSKASSYVVWMCRESKVWVRGTAQTREDAFSLEQWFSACGLKALRNPGIASKGSKMTPKQANQTNVLATATGGKPLA